MWKRQFNWWRLFLAACLIGLAPGAARGPLDHDPTMAATRIYFGPSAGFESIDPALIARARQQIDMAAYVLTERRIIDALEAAARRGVRVRLYFDGDQRDPHDGEPADRLTPLLHAPGVAAKFKASGRDMMHFKAYHIDRHWLRTGSANFTISGTRRLDNDIVVMESAEAATAFAERFERMWVRRDNDVFHP